MYGKVGLVGFLGAGAGALWVPPEPPVPGEDPPELDPLVLAEELEGEELEEVFDVGVLVAGGDGSGTNGSRVGPRL
jgi:hypothetical protein